MTTGSTSTRKRVDVTKPKAKEVAEKVKEKFSQANTSKRALAATEKREIGKVMMKSFRNSKKTGIKGEIFQSSSLRSPAIIDKNRT